MMDKLAEAKKVFDTEINALLQTRDSLDESFIKVVELIHACQGKVILTGMGKSGHIANKLAATFSSLGVPSFYLHPAEALHGDLGMIGKEDVVIAISHSGESQEVIRMIPSIKWLNSKLVSITCSRESTLAIHSDIAVELPDFREACHLGMAPTSSTTSVLVYGDALAIVSSMWKGFNQEMFGIFHPAGSLGKQILTRVSDIMYVEDRKPRVPEGASLKDAIIEMAQKSCGIVIIEADGYVKGVITDGDLRRALNKEYDVYSASADSIMTKAPFVIEENKLAVDALRLLQDNNISALPVVDKNQKYVGLIDLHLLMQA